MEKTPCLFLVTPKYPARAKYPVTSSWMKVHMSLMSSRKSPWKDLLPVNSPWSRKYIQTWLNVKAVTPFLSHVALWCGFKPWFDVWAVVFVASVLSEEVVRYFIARIFSEGAAHPIECYWQNDVGWFREGSVEASFDCIFFSSSSPSSFNSMRDYEQRHILFIFSHLAHIYWAPSIFQILC